jgi:hypothetical protein
VLTKQAFDVLWEVYADIEAIKVGSSAFSDLCQTDDSTGLCTLDGPLKFWSGNRTAYEAEVSSDDDIVTVVSTGVYPDGSTVSYDTVFGSKCPHMSPRIYAHEAIITAEMTWSGDDLVSAEGMLQQFFLSEGSTSTRMSWELKYIDVVTSSYSGAKVYGEADRCATNTIRRCACSAV